MISHIPLFFILPPLSPLIFKYGLLLWVKVKQVKVFRYIYTLQFNNKIKGVFTQIICYPSVKIKKRGAFAPLNLLGSNRS